MTTEFELPQITDTEKLHVALNVMKSKRSVQKFVAEHGLDVLESVKKVVDTVIEEAMEEIRKEEEVRKNHENALKQAAQGYVDAMKAAGIEVSLNDALEKLSSVNAETPVKKKNPRNKYKFLIGGEVVTRPFARPTKEIEAEMAEKGYTDQYMLLAPESFEQFLKDAETNPKYKSRIEEIEAFFAKKRKSSKEHDVTINTNIEVELALDIETAREKFSIEMTEDFVFKGAISDLTPEQEKLLIAISDDHTVEGGIDAIEALDL
ncbi:hypothetical protein O8Q24_000078 [Vibrio parahaemolyticus]|nr:hypothetical protein [Vibrio parahaemolyticus]EII3049366.1 hypothetical protein [Vibrio parahaemolyticus]EIN5967364.1 hypothetical protein [Vibrio parahaemolyticus]EKH5869237.1 hypothetical protein [Vibrio parahaemolyticus]ELA7390490.1 hypothetical protein [Vibrio parahaemolyticus]